MSKKILKYNDIPVVQYVLIADVQELQRAVSAQQIASPHPYKKDYKEQIIGKGPQDPTIGYPEHDHHKKVGELTSAVREIKVIDSNAITKCWQSLLF